MIQSDNSVVLIMLVLLVVVLVVWLERFKFGKTVPSAITALLIGLMLSNLKVIPFSAPAYGWVVQYLVPLAIPLLLFKTNLRNLLGGTGRLLILFCAGACGTIIGGIIGFFLLPLGPAAAKIMGPLVATYIGGSVNFITVAQVVGLNEPTALTAAIAADNIVGTFYLIIITVLAGNKIFQHFFVMKGSAMQSTSAVIPTAAPINLIKTISLIALSAIICVVSFKLADWLLLTQIKLLLITGLAILSAHFLPKKLLDNRGEFEVGMFLMYIFFVTIGASSDVGLLIAYGPWVILYAAIICTTHLLVISIFTKIFRFNYAELIIASNACVLGPATAVALAGHKQWVNLITPALLCGLFGYVIANIIGVSISLWF